MPDSTKIHDVCIIGSGASGGMTAHVLTKKGLDVVMLEAGPMRSVADLPNHRLQRWNLPYRGLRGDVTLASRLDRDLGIDSLGRTELVLRIERKFRVRLSVTEVAEMDSVGDLLKAVDHAAPGGHIAAAPSVVQAATACCGDQPGQCPRDPDVESPGTRRRVPGFSIGVPKGHARILVAFPRVQASRRRSRQAARPVSTTAYPHRTANPFQGPS